MSGLFSLQAVREEGARVLGTGFRDQRGKGQVWGPRQREVLRMSGLFSLQAAREEGGVRVWRRGGFRVAPG